MRASAEEIRRLRADPVCGPLNRRLKRAVVGSVVAGALLVFACDAVAIPAVSGHPLAGLESVAAFLLYLALTVPAGRARCERGAVEMTRWYLEGRAPTVDERGALIHAPLRLAMEVFSGWLGAAVLFGVLVGSVFGSGARAATLVAVMNVLGGLTSAAVASFLCLQLLRPVMAPALAGGAERGHILPLQQRLLLAWSLGSAIPVVAIIVVALLAPELDRVRTDLVVCLLGGGALVVGAIITRTASRSITDRVAEVAAALSSVERGDVGVSVLVDDPGEIGVLQQGVNRMTEALRERRQMREIFGRHVGADVAELALRRQQALGAEQCEVSVLAVDVVGSTGIAEQRPPAEVVAMLNALFAAVVREVSAEGGWVNKFEGDGALCVFGTPTAQPDHAARALRAARALQHEIGALRQAYPALDAGIGVSSGVAVAGNIGAEERYEYTVLGTPVNEAARLCDAAKRNPARLLAAGTSVAAAGEEATGWELDGVVTLRGRAGSTDVHRPRTASMHPRHGGVAGETLGGAYSR